MANLPVQPWTETPAHVGFIGQPGFQKWDTANFPYVVTWAVSYPDRLTHWISHTREFRTLAEAVAAYRKPFKGLDVRLSVYNGGKPGEHMTRLAYRKCGKPTKWAAEVPKELRG